MFDIEDKELIKKYIDSRKADAIITPLYINHYGKLYNLNEVDQIHDYCPGALKIGFGGCSSILEKKPFPMNTVYMVDVVSVFDIHDEVKNIEVKYIVFETTGLDGIDGIAEELYEQIDFYLKMLNDYVSKSVKEYKRKLLESLEY